MKDQLVNAIAEMQEEEALQLTQEMLDAGENPQVILDACREAMAIVGERYEQREYFLPELVVAGEMLEQIGELVKPRLEGEAVQAEPVGKIVLGTVAGDIHDIGKDIVAFMLEVNNYQVFNLGVDVPAQTFVEKLKEVDADILALSGFLTLAFDQMKLTVKAVQEAGLRDEVKIMIGGAPMDEAVVEYIGADAFGPDAAAAVRLANDWIGG
jgi:5-methyltetrahydrofolate--homocysteine methyltransferase